MKKALANFQFSTECLLRSVPEEKEVDYLNEKLDHDHWIIT